MYSVFSRGDAMEHSVTYLGLIPLMPLIGAVIMGLMHMLSCTGRTIPEKIYSLLAMVGPVLSTLLAFRAFRHVATMPEDARYLSQKVFTWMQVGELNVSMGFLADPLSCLMLLFVTFIGTLIHFYSIGYMAGERNYGKFFAYLNLFLGSMLILVLGWYCLSMYPKIKEKKPL